MDEKLIFLKDTFKELGISSLKYKDSNFELELSSEKIDKKDAKVFVENPVIEESDVSIKKDKKVKKDLLEVKSPLVGLFYSRPDPEEKAFVELNQKVKKGDILCILEAMKMFNEVKSPVNGIIRNINFKDEDLVSVNDILFEIEE